MVSKNSDLSLELEKNGDKPPKDKYWIVYYLISVMGLVHIIPWTFFANATDYWMYKFRNTSIDQDADPDYRTSLQVQFTPSITGILEASTISFYILGLFFGHKVRLQVKMYGVFVSVLLLFCISTLFIFIDTDNWQGLFFGITMVIILMICGFNAILGLVIMEVVSFFPPMYIGGYITGVAIASLFTASLQVVALAIGISTRVSAVVYFGTATAVIALSFVTLVLVVNNNAFYIYHYTNRKQEANKMLSFDRIWYIFKKIWPSGGIMFFWTLSVSVHPSLTVLVVSEGAGNGPWNDKFFVPVIVFLLCAIIEYWVRILTLRIKPRPKPLHLVIYTALSCVVFMPLVMLCNAQPRNHLPVVFPHDYQFILIMVFFTFAHVYFSTMVPALVPDLVPEDELKDALQVNIVVTALCLAILAFLPFVIVDAI